MTLSLTVSIWSLSPVSVESSLETSSLILSSSSPAGSIMPMAPLLFPPPPDSADASSVWW